VFKLVFVNMTWTERRTYARYNGSHFEVGALSDLTLVCVCRFDVLVKNSDNVSRAELVSFVYGMKRKESSQKIYRATPYIFTLTPPNSVIQSHFFTTFFRKNSRICCCL